MTDPELYFGIRSYSHQIHKKLGTEGQQCNFMQRYSVQSRTSQIAISQDYRVATATMADLGFLEGDQVQKDYSNSMCQHVLAPPPPKNNK